MLTFESESVFVNPVCLNTNLCGGQRGNWAFGQSNTHLHHPYQTVQAWTVSLVATDELRGADA